MTRIRTAGAIACVFSLWGCDDLRGLLEREAPPPPASEAVASYYEGQRGVNDVAMSGNVAELRVQQPYGQIQRGGSLWARVGPYVYLFSPQTRRLFEEQPGVAAVRVITVLPDGDEVARAMLRRDRLSSVLWRRSLNILGHALQQGRENPRRLEELTEWGEQYTSYEYNPDYVNP